MDHCQYYYPDLVSFTSPDPRKALTIRRYWWLLKRYVWYIRILGLFKFIKRMLSYKIFRKKAYKNQRKKIKKITSNKNLNLQPGELVEVRSKDEIFDTLDSDGKLKGLRFTRELSKYCGKQFRVYKRLEKIIIEATGELRTIRTPTVLLEGVFCDGSAHGGCDRSCFCFWREAWLKRVTPNNSQEQKSRVAI